MQATPSPQPTQGKGGKKSYITTGVACVKFVCADGVYLIHNSTRHYY